MKCISPVFLFGLPNNLYQMAWLGHPPRLFQSSTSGLGLPTYGQISALVDPQFRCSSVPLSKVERRTLGGICIVIRSAALPSKNL